MRLLGLIILLSFAQGCDPYGFGFKHNPAYVLNEAFKAVSNQNEEAFLDVTGKEALCLYGNPDGMAYLKQKLKLNLDQVDIRHNKLESKYFNLPILVGSPAYWSYFHERYLVDVFDKNTNATLLKVAVDCNYGVEGKKNVKYQNLKPKKYKRKECTVTKILPVTFEGLKITKRCEHLKVNL